MKSHLHSSWKTNGTVASHSNAIYARSLMKAILCGILAVSSLIAEAVPLTWTLDGVIFQDGGTANGSFVYDADTNIFSDIEINTTAGTDFAGATYTDFLFGNDFSGLQVVPDASLPSLVGSLEFTISWSSPLTNNGGTIDVPIAVEGLCQNAACDVASAIRATEFFTGSVTAVPIPPALYLFGSGLLALIGISRRTRAA